MMNLRVRMVGDEAERRFGGDYRTMEWRSAKRLFRM
jgi:hypothetical protein